MTQDDINAIAARVISIEADALRQMAGDLPADFAGAVEAILQTKGRVIVSVLGNRGILEIRLPQPWPARARLPVSFMQPRRAMGIWAW
jgi:Predicted sugar phosphate isomerase involved in capsule formation